VSSIIGLSLTAGSTTGLCQLNVGSMIRGGVVLVGSIIGRFQFYSVVGVVGGVVLGRGFDHWSLSA
jgi:hypothetical protein